MTTRLNIDLLRSFVAIAEARVMSRAATRVGRTQAALSQQVKRLETEVQQTLMIRSGRGITLTAQGERLFLHAQNILRTHDEAVGELLGLSLSGERDPRSQPSGNHRHRQRVGRQARAHPQQHDVAAGG